MATTLSSMAVSEADGDSIAPYNDPTNNGVYYRITSLIFTTVEVGGFQDGMERESIDIPETIISPVSKKTYTVTGVDDGAFKDKKMLKSVKLPNTITRIKPDAFNGCSISDVVIPGSVYHVEDRAFAGNPIKTVTIYGPGYGGAAVTPSHSVELCDQAFGAADDPTLTDVNIYYPAPPIVETGRVPFPYVATHQSKVNLNLVDDADADQYRTADCWKDFYVVGGHSAIGEVAVDQTDAPVEYFNVQGVAVDADHLVPGLYIARQGHKVSKIVIR